MIKKVLAGVVGAVVLGVVVYGTSFFGYLRTATDEIHKAADDAVPMDFKLADAERMVKELDPEIKRVMTLVAKLQVDVDDINKSVTTKEIELGKAKEQILALKSELDKGDKEYVFEGQNYSADQVRTDLDGKFNRFKRDTEVLNREKDVLKARQEALTVSEGHLDEMITAKRDLESQMEFLKSRVETEKAAEALGKSEIVDSNSKMAKAQKVIAELNKKLDVNDKVRHFEGRLATDIKIPEKKDVKNVSQEIENFFGDEAKPKTEL